MENETEYLQPVIGTLHTERFKPITTIKGSVFQIIILILIQAVVIISTLPQINIIPKCSLFYLVIYCQASFWFVCLVLDHYYKWRHHFVRLNGHFEFHAKISKYSSLPLYITSLWNAILLAMLGILYDFIPAFDKSCTNPNLLSLSNVLNLTITLEVLVLLPLLVTYILCVHQFNKNQPVSDVERRECWTLEDSVTAAEVGYRCEGEAIVDLLQKQADLIFYYKATNEALNNKLMELSARMVGKDS